MIIITSIESDPSTDKVMDWLNYEFKVPHCRVNGSEWFNANSQTSFAFGNDSAQVSFGYQGKTFLLEEVTATWSRKDSYPIFSKDVGHGDSTNEQVNEHLKDEYYYGKHGLYELLKKQAKHNIGGKVTSQPQKINNLLVAKSIGIDIPSTLVTTQKKDLLAFYKKHNGAITKPIMESRRISNEEDLATMYVMDLPEEVLNDIPEKFAISLFQERLEIAFDIRVFYLDGAFYPIAIFTKKGNNRVDVRNTSRQNKEFRETRYKLSPTLEEQLTELMDQLGLVSGSLDLIHTKDGRTVFLEVNPWGQYGNVSRSGNYFINEKVAAYLAYGSKRK